MSEFDHEPVPGLPEELPAGETMLWQGAPDAWALARRALHAGAASLYIGAISAWALASAYQNSQPWTEGVMAAGRVVLAGAIGVGLLGLLAWLMARSTLYTLTDRRVVMRFGVALPVSINIPHRLIGTADLKLHSDGTGDIALGTNGDVRLGFVPLWPHVRAWHLKRPQPMLRCVPEAQALAQLIASTLATANGGTATAKPAAAASPSRARPLHETGGEPAAVAA